MNQNFKTAASVRSENSLLYPFLTLYDFMVEMFKLFHGLLFNTVHYC
jgi:hypothetical protein